MRITHIFLFFYGLRTFRAGRNDCAFLENEVAYGLAYTMHWLAGSAYFMRKDPDGTGPVRPARLDPRFFAKRSKKPNPTH